MSDSLSTRDYEGATIPAAGTYEIDISHSEVGFSVRHMMVSKVRGNFGDVAGTITVAEDPLASKVDVAIQVASVDTKNPDRDGHLKSADFFDAETYPTITFASTGVSDFDGGSLTVAGDLTVRDVTRPVSFRATYEGVARDPWGGERIGFEGRLELDRGDFGLEWNQALETGGVLVGRTANLEVVVEAVRQG